MRVGSVVLGFAIVAGVAWTFLPTKPGPAPIIPETKTVKEILTPPERKVAEPAPPVRLDKVANLSEECSKTAIAAANFGIRPVLMQLRKTIIEKPGDRAFWLRIGWAFLNRDGSYSLNLDALPVNGKLQMRDWQPRDDDPTRASREQREPREDREPRLAAV